MKPTVLFPSTTPTFLSSLTYFNSEATQCTFGFEGTLFNPIPPIVITGTPEVVEAELIQFLKSPATEKLVSVISGVAEFEQAADKAAKDNKMAEEIKKKIEKLCDEGTKFVTDKELIKAEKCRDEILTIDSAPSGKKWKDFNK